MTSPSEDQTKEELLARLTKLLAAGGVKPGQTNRKSIGSLNITASINGRGELYVGYLYLDGLKMLVWSQVTAWWDRPELISQALSVLRQHMLLDDLANV